MLSRRYFLAAGAGSLASLGLPFTVLGKMSSDTPAVPSIAHKLQAVCDVYREGQLVARLNIVGLETPFRQELRLDQFILNFEATVPVNLPEASYEIYHPTLGRLHLLLQPCGFLNQDEHDGRQYRACMAVFR